MNEVATQPPTAKTNGQVAKRDLSHSERFTNAVEKEFSSNAGELNLTSFQKKLCQNYFIKIDSVLKDAENKRLKKQEKYRDPLPLTWENVNMQRLAVDVISYSAVGLDPTQPNHINPIPFKNTATGKYEIVFIMGYKGIELKAFKYGFDVPDDIVVELVYSTDSFKQFKKDLSRKVEGYTFEITKDFDRGEIVGGFYYHTYFEKPEKNKLKVFSKKDIEKRKPDHASAEFWGGEKDKWVDGKKVGKEQVEGWYEEMAYKTIFRAAHNAITIDSEKIDENFLAVIQRERETNDLKIENEIKSYANGEEIGFEEVPGTIENVNKETGEVIGEAHEEAQPEEPVKQPIPQGTQTKAPF